MIDWLIDWHTNGSNRFLRSECSSETEAGDKAGKLASVDVAGFVENVDFTRVKISFSRDNCHTSGPGEQNGKKITGFNKESIKLHYYGYFSPQHSKATDLQ